MQHQKLFPASKNKKELMMKVIVEFLVEGASPESSPLTIDLPFKVLPSIGTRLGLLVPEMTPGGRFYANREDEAMWVIVHGVRMVYYSELIGWDSHALEVEVDQERSPMSPLQIKEAVDRLHARQYRSRCLKKAKKMKMTQLDLDRDDFDFLFHQGCITVADVARLEQGELRTNPMKIERIEEALGKLFKGLTMFV